MFEGTLENVIKCINVDFESSNGDIFNTLQLTVKDHKTIEESILHYIAQEKLEGPDQFETETGHGKQDARKFIRFTKLPPVL